MMERPPLEDRSGLPASSTQRRLWFDAEQRLDGAAFHSVLAWRVPGGLRGDALSAALNALVARHDALRATIRPVDGLLQQAIADPGPVVVSVRHLRDDLQARMREFFRAPMSLTSGPLFRARLFRSGDGSGVLMLVIHHIVVDGYSLDVLQRDLAELYAAAAESRRPLLTEPAPSFADFAVREAEEAGPLMDDLDRAAERLKGAATLPMPLDRRRPAVRSFLADRVEVMVPLDTCGDMVRLARACGSTPFAVVLSAFQISLARWCAAGDVVVGLAMANRGTPEVAELVGPLVNLVPLRTTIDESRTFAQQVQLAREDLFTALACQHVPFDRLVERSVPARVPGTAPLVQVAVGDNSAFAATRSDALGVRIDFTDPGVTHFDLALDLERHEGRLMLALSFATEVFDRPSIERLAARLLDVLARGCAQPHAVLATTGTVTDCELNELRLLGAGGEEGHHEDVVARIAAWPADRVAVVDGDAETTYGELLERASALAGELRARGVEAESAVGVFLPRSADLVVALLAALWVGAVYVPLDPVHPPDRLRFMADDCGLDLVVTSRALVPRLPSGTAVIAVDGIRSGDAAPYQVSHPGTLAYTIYTSGSTGRPKGVQVTRGALAHLAGWYASAFGIGHQDVVPHLAGTGFDASLLEVVPTLVAGARLLVVPDEHRVDPATLCELMEKAGVNAAFLVTPMFTALRESGDLPASLERVQVGGDELRSVPGGRFTLTNLYGPTEVTIVATAATLTAGDRPHIGGPRPGLRAHVLDQWLRPVPRGTVGQLCVAGSGLARGYRGSPGLTAERFVPDPLAGDGSRMYLTGDLVRWAAHGGLEYLGRTDGQVKIRGFRVEIGEVERAIAEVDGVRSVAVAVRRDPRTGEGLVAYYTGEAPPEALPAPVRRRLPSAMVPQRFVRLPALPTTPNGKVDRAALPACDTGGGRTRLPPEGPVAEIVAAAWSEVLGVSPINADDDFFALGGHSLLCARVAARLGAGLGLRVPISLMFDRPVLSELAAEVEALIVTQIEGTR